MQINNLRKVLLCGAFLFFGCSLSVRQLDPQLALRQETKWQSFTLRGKATLWEEGKELPQKFFLKKQNDSLRMICYGGGVTGFTPTPTLSVEVAGKQVSYRTKNANGKLTPQDKQTKSLYAVLFAFSRLHQVYKSGNLQVGEAKIKVDKSGNPVKISSGGIVLQLRYKNNELSELELYFGWRKVLLAEIKID